MKRCPECEFIYEDDQSLCDMDGALLVFDGRSLPNLHALARIDVPGTPRTHARHRAFSATAALILATVLSLGYFVSTQQTKRVPAPVPFAGVPLTTTPAATSTTISPDANQTQSAPVVPATNSTATTKENSKPASAKLTAPPAKKAAAQTPTTQRKPEEPTKEDSKVGSILKKTGRLLKKPFKL